MKTRIFKKTLSRILALSLALCLFTTSLPMPSFATSPEAPPATEEAAAEVTPEATPEATPEPTPEVTPEPAPEATPEPTPEATPEPTPEATPEPTPEVAPEPIPEVTPAPAPEVTPAPAPEAISEVIYDITTSAGPNGTISPSSTGSIQDGDATITITPDEGYEIDELFVDGIPQGAAAALTLKRNQNHTVGVTFKPLTYEITASAGEYGTISPSGTVRVSYKDSKTFTFTPKWRDYSVKRILVDGVELAPADSYTFTDITENHTISVEFRHNTTGNLLITGLEHGWVCIHTGAIHDEPAGKGVHRVDFYNYTRIRLSVNPNSDFYLSSILFNGVPLTANGGYFTTPQLNDYAVIVVKFSPYPIYGQCGPKPRYSRADGGTVLPKNFSLSPGDTFSPVITAEEGYYVDDVEVARSVRGKQDEYRITMTPEELKAFAATPLSEEDYWQYRSYSCTVAFFPITYQTTTSAGPHGEITPSYYSNIEDKKSRVSISPDQFYEIDELILDGVSQDVVPQAPTTSLTLSWDQDHTVSVTFKPIVYHAINSAGENGTISPSSSGIFTDEAAEIIITPNQGYEIDQLVSNGYIYQSPPHHLTFPRECDFLTHVTFKPITYQLTTSAGANGTISPSSSGIIADKDAEITITPAEGYEIDELLVNGVPQAPTTSLTLRRDQNHTVSVTFKPIAVVPTPLPTPDPSPVPTPDPSPVPTPDPSPVPTPDPSPAPTTEPSPAPTTDPSPAPTTEPSPAPTTEPSPAPTTEPDSEPNLVVPPVDDGTPPTTGTGTPTVQTVATTPVIPAVVSPPKATPRPSPSPAPKNERLAPAKNDPGNPNYGITEDPTSPQDQGHSHLLLLLILVVVCTLGGGWTYWERKVALEMEEE